MADRSVRRSVPDDAESAGVDGEREDGDALPEYSPWVSFYGFFHRYVRRRLLVFGGSAVLGALTAARHVWTLDSGTAEESMLSTGVALCGVLLSAFGVGYFVVRNDTSCRECDTAFSKERVGKRLVRREVRGEPKVFVAETLECRHCGNSTTDISAHPEQQPPQY